MIFSASNGNWNAGVTWSGGIPPGLGETATITHAVAVTTAQTVGISPGAGGTAAITVNAGGSLTVNAGVLLKVRGDVVLGNAAPAVDFVMGAGAILEFDGVAAPAGTHYALRPGYLSRLTLNGTAGARCVIRSSTVGKEGSIAHTGFRWDWVGTYFDFLNLGTASIPCVQPREGIVDIANWIFDVCGEIQTFYEPADLTVRYVNGTMKNSVGASCLNHGNSPVPLTTGTRVIQGCVFDKPLTHTFRDYSITDCLFWGDPALSALSAGSLPWATFSGNLLMGTGGSETVIAGPVADCYHLQSSAGNPHYFQVVFTTTIRGTIFEYLGTTADGDGVQPSVGTGPYTVTVEGCLGLPNAAGGSSGTMFSLLGNANTTMKARHNTWFGGGQACGVVGETYAGHVGLLNEFRDNLCWDVSATTHKLHNISSVINDLVSAGSIHHNGGYLMAAGSNGGGYDNLHFSSGTPGASDVNGVDPNFVDRTRDIAAWDGSIAGGAGTAAHALAELKKKNDVSGYNPAYKISDLIAWVKSGFIPQAGAYHAASDTVSPSNGWIGALEGSTVTPPPPAGWTLIASTAKPSSDGEDVTTDPICTAGATLLVAVIGAFLGAGATGILDSHGNTWQPRTVYTSSTAARLQTFYVENPIVSAVGVTDHTFTTVGPAGNVPSICVMAWSGNKSSGAYDQENGAGNDSAASIQAGSGVTPTEPNELVIAGAMIRHAQNIVSITGTGFTLLLNVGAASLAMRTGMAYQIQTTPAALANPTWNFDGPQYCAANLATFKAAPVTAAVGDLGLLGIG